mmetsp:Transcript_27448/g.20606  ORF Transcript_27448/g.20606 Transcript_27448/m.20606 type:complete len:119 (-) Transcript_27448:92-448(-)
MTLFKQKSSTNLLGGREKGPNSEVLEQEQNDIFSKIEEAQSEQRPSLVGTAEYISPEVLEGEDATTSSDLWSLGIILYQFVQGKTPFRGTSDNETFKKVQRAEFDFKESIPEETKDLI